MNRIYRLKRALDLPSRYGVWRTRRTCGYKMRDLNHHCTFCHKLITKWDDVVSLGSPVMMGGPNFTSCKKCCRYNVSIMDQLRLEHWKHYFWKFTTVSEVEFFKKMKDRGITDDIIMQMM